MSGSVIPHRDPGNELAHRSEAVIGNGRPLCAAHHFTVVRVRHIHIGHRGKSQSNHTPPAPGLSNRSSNASATFFGSFSAPVMASFTLLSCSFSSPSQIPPQEGRRCEQQAHFVLLDQLSQLRHFERTGVGHHADPFDHRVPHRHSAAKAVGTAADSRAPFQSTSGLCGRRTGSR